MEFIELNCVLKNMHITVTRTVLEVTKSAAAVEILVLPTFFFLLSWWYAFVFSIRIGLINMVKKFHNL